MFVGFKSLLRKNCPMRVVKCRSYSVNDAGCMNKFQSTQKRVNQEFDVILGERFASFDHFAQIIIDEVQDKISSKERNTAKNTCSLPELQTYNVCNSSTLFSGVKTLNNCTTYKRSWSMRKRFVVQNKLVHLDGSDESTTSVLDKFVWRAFHFEMDVTSFWWPRPSGLPRRTRQNWSLLNSVQAAYSIQRTTKQTDKFASIKAETIDLRHGSEGAVSNASKLFILLGHLELARSTFDDVPLVLLCTHRAQQTKWQTTNRLTDQTFSDGFSWFQWVCPLVFVSEVAHFTESIFSTVLYAYFSISIPLTSTNLEKTFFDLSTFETMNFFHLHCIWYIHCFQ